MSHIPDLSIPSFAGAVFLARAAAAAHASAGGLVRLRDEDRAAGNRVLARCLFHVEARDGGFLGADAGQADAICRRLNIGAGDYSDALWHAPEPWPPAIAIPFLQERAA